ncbi:MAG: hypothetical protein BroJett026_14510 [Betaproteobacteria bacterium]|nr:MAG: hypothetical protein BroJett026_14510 [Betaproteobacteria bacterium]
MSAPISVPAIALGLGLLVAYWVWLWAFFAKLRPGIMAVLGRRLRVKVAESTSPLDAGTYDVEDEDAPIRKQGAVWGVDALVIVLGTVGVAASVFVPAFMVAERGALLAWEAALTGRGATLAVPAEAAWPRDARAIVVRVEARNAGREPLPRCQVRTADYRARDGYLHGHSALFDLPAGATRALDLPLEATRALAARTQARLRLDCGDARYAAAMIVLAPPAGGTQR